MRFSQLLRLPLWLAGALLALVLLSYLVPDIHDGRETASSSIPARLVIPKIRLNAPIEPVGIAPNGTMGVPREPNVTGWFEPGRRPGEVGSAVIAGHSGWKDGVAASFDELSALRQGDEIRVEDSEGITRIFIVREIRTYDSHANADEVFRSADGKAHLNLITCEGEWNESTQTYSLRYVVFAEAEEGI